MLRASCTALSHAPCAIVSTHASVSRFLLVGGVTAALHTSPETANAGRRPARRPGHQNRRGPTRQRAQQDGGQVAEHLQFFQDALQQLEQARVQLESVPEVTELERTLLTMQLVSDLVPLLDNRRQWDVTVATHNIFVCQSLAAMIAHCWVAVCRMQG